MLQDPFRQNADTASDDDLTSLVETGPVSNAMGRRALFDEAQVTDRAAGFVVSDDRRAFDAQRARVFGDQYRNELSAEAANARYGVAGELTFDGPVNEHRAVEMNRQATLRRFREDTAARADLSALESIGASVLGSATDPVMLPTWFIGGGSAAVRALGVAGGAGRGAAIARGATVGVIDGLTGGVVAEGINAAARLSTGEDYTGRDALRNILFGAALGATVGGAVGAATGGSPNPRRTPRRTPQQTQVADLIGSAAARRGENAATALRIAEIESNLDPRADNPASSASGVFQFMSRTWRGMGGGDVWNANLNVERGIELLAQNRAGLRRRLSREPQEWELYLAHQQGAGGAFELLRDPNRPAVDALRAAGQPDPVAAVRLNGGSVDMTARQFASKWMRNFGGGGAMSGPTIEAMTPPRPPRALDGLTQNERVGAFTESLEAIAEDAPVDLGSMLARNGLDALDEATAVPSIRGRWLEADTAITRSGGEVPVRFAVVELADLKTSHSDDLTPLPDYPQALQPRDRSRAGSQAENYNLERDLNPALLMRDRAASGGAPIVSPDGLVESGNGRTIALRRSAATGTEAWGRYQAELARAGVDVSGYDRPVLVRMRSEPMTGAGRADMARELNVSQTEGFSPVEQAKADARRLDADTLGLIDGDDAFAAANRPFLKGFVARVAPNDANALTDARGALSLAGKSRVQAALVQRAYGDEALTAALFETSDANIQAIGRALADAAPAWAKMRAEAPREMDLTANLTGAVAMIREARSARMSVGELVAERLGQTDLFGGEALSPETAAMIQLMFRDEALTKPRAADRIAEALKDYARGAAGTPAGQNLFGETPDGRAFLDTLLAHYAAAEGEGQRGLAYAGGSEPAWTTREVDPPGLDLRPAESVGERPGGTGDGQGGGGAAAGAGERFSFETAPDGSGQMTWAVEVKNLGEPDPDFGAMFNGVSGRVEGQDWIIHVASLPENARGRGLAVDMYAEAARQAAAAGGRLTSDSVRGTSPSAARVWDGLKRRGFGVERNAAARQDVDGQWVTPDKAPVFTVASVPEPTVKPEARVAAFIAADPELKALMADTEALATANGVEMPAFERSTEPSTIAEAIRAAAFCLASDIVV